MGLLRVPWQGTKKQELLAVGGESMASQEKWMVVEGQSMCVGSLLGGEIDGGPSMAVCDTLLLPLPSHS